MISVVLNSVPNLNYGRNYNLRNWGVVIPRWSVTSCGNGTGTWNKNSRYRSYESILVNYDA